RQLAGVAIELVGEFEIADRQTSRMGKLDSPRKYEIAQVASQRAAIGGDSDVLQHAHVVKQLDGLKGSSDALRVSRPGRSPIDPSAFEHDRTLRRDQTADRIDESGFP